MKRSRRDFFKTAGAGVAGLSLGPSVIASCDAGNNKRIVSSNDDQVLFIGDNIAIADTLYGKVKGFLLRGIYCFRGIPYGADTSGKNRFLPPQKPEPWKDVFPAVWWGNSAPQIMEKRYANAYASFVDHWNYDDVSEDCLKLNIWTPGINDGKKRPVLVWLHGGGFINGNGIEQDGYDGENFSRQHDTVFCSLNHRLGPLGFTNFGGISEKFALSGNVGMLDIVAALEWIRDNIAFFGGDPQNVTIMGQSGGGAKVCLLTAMPAAQGLFHKAVVLSGAMTRAAEKDYAEKLGQYIMKEAGLSADELFKLQDIQWQEYYSISSRAAEKLNRELGPSDFFRRGFNPCVDGKTLLQHPYFPEGAPSAENIPMLICSTFHEFYPGRTDASFEKISLNEIKEQLKNPMGFFRGFGAKADQIVDAYVKAFPGKTPAEIYSLILSNRKSTIALADAKAKQKAPVYLAWFGWQPPLFDNRMKAFHCLDICFWFHNTDVMLTHTGGGKRPRILSEKMSASLAQFMRTGSPNGGGLPDWPPYSSVNGETMILDDLCEVKNDPDREARAAIPD